MNFKKHLENVDFVKHRKKFFIFSSFLIIAGAILLSTIGLNLGIDFTSGTRIELLSNQTLTADIVTEQFAKIGLTPDSILLAGDNQEMAYASFIGPLVQEDNIKVQNHFLAEFGEEPNIISVSPTVARIYRPGKRDDSRVDSRCIPTRCRKAGQGSTGLPALE